MGSNDGGQRATQVLRRIARRSTRRYRVPKDLPTSLLGSMRRLVLPSLLQTPEDV